MLTPDPLLDELEDVRNAYQKANGYTPIMKPKKAGSAIVTPTEWVPGMIVTPGFYKMPAKAYHSQVSLETPALSYSIAKTLLGQSPRHAYECHSKLGNHKRAESDDFDRGKIFHTLILGDGDELAICPATYVDEKGVVKEINSWATNYAKAFRAEAYANDQVPVLEVKMDGIAEAAKRIKEQIDKSECADFFAPEALTECAAYAEVDGVLIQTLMDRVNFRTGVIHDLKTIESAGLPSVKRQIMNMMYFFQSEFYKLPVEKLIRELYGKLRFVFIFVEVKEPYAVGYYEISDEWKALAARKIDQALKRWSECLTTDTWPAYPQKIVTIEPPSWAAFDNEIIATDDY